MDQLLFGTAKKLSATALSQQSPRDPIGREIPALAHSWPKPRATH